MSGPKTPLEGGLLCANLGMRVFPEQQAVIGDQNTGKHPLLTGWKDDATTRNDVIRRWAETYDGCNFGIRLSAELVVVEVDPYQGGHLRVLRDLVGELGPMSVSGRGIHVFFSGANVPNGYDLGPGLTVRSEGYQVVAPGSMHWTGRRYGRRMYGWDEMHHRPQLEVPNMVGNGQAKKSSLQVPEMIPAGSRHDTLMRTAGSLSLKGLSEAAIVAALRVTLEERGENGPGVRSIPDSELESMARTAVETVKPKSSLSLRLAEAAARGGDREAESTPADAMPFTMERLSKRRPRAYHLAWNGRLVRGGLSIIRGDEKIGKGTLLVHLIAAATRGEIEGLPDPVFVFVFTKEDRGVIDGRLIGAGAAGDLVDIQAMGQLTLPSDIPHLERMAKDAHDEGHANVWFYFDGLQSYFELHIDTTKNAQRVGHVLDELTMMAERSKSYVLTNMHTNRSTTFTSARDRDAHSMEFRRVARSNLYLIQPPDEENDIRDLGQEGNNYGPNAPTLRYRIKVVPIDTVDDDGSTVRRDFPVMELLGTTDGSVNEHYLREADSERRIKDSRSEPTRVEQAKEAIVAFWNEQGKPERFAANLIMAHLELRGFRRGKTTQAAKTALGITTENPAGVGQPGFWSFASLLDAPSFTRPSQPEAPQAPHAVHSPFTGRVNHASTREDTNTVVHVVHPRKDGGEPRGEPGSEPRVICPSCGQNNGRPGARSECWKPDCKAPLEVSAR
jgi:hypothetical protein